MDIICSVVFFLTAWWGKLVKGRWSNLLTIFSGFYAIIISLANLRFYGINRASDETFDILIVGVISFMIGYCIITAFYQKYTRGKGYHTDFSENATDMDSSFLGKYGFRYYVVYIVLIFVVLYSVVELLSAVRLVMSGFSYGRIRSLYFNDNELGYGRSSIDIFVYLPLLQAMVLISSVLFFINGGRFTTKERTRILLVTFACEVMSMFTNGGRENIFYAICIFVFTYFVTRTKEIKLSDWRSLDKRSKRIVIFVVVIGIVGMLIMTQNRNLTGDNSSGFFLRKIYIYFSGWLPNLSARLEMINSSDYTYGSAFLLGLTKLPVLILYKIGIPYTAMHERALQITHSLQYRINIGSGITFNAYVSPFYYFFRDFGYVSLIFESFLFGAFCAIVESKYQMNKNAKSLFWLLFAFFLIISSMVRWEMVHEKTGMIVYYALVLIKKYASKEQERLK